MQYQELENEKVVDADVVIACVAFGESISGKAGTEMAPPAILESTNQLEFYDEDLDWSPMKHMSVCVSGSVSDYEKITPTIKALGITNKQLLISLGGDHSITPQITRGLLKKPLTVVFLDAHGDLRTSYLGNEYSHATPAHHLLEDSHKLIMIGIRSLFETEALRVKEDENITFFSDRSLRQESKKQEVLALLASLEGEVYLSIDMDVFDPACVPGVGTPQPGGIDYYFATDILEALFLKSKAEIKGVDIVELIPEESEVSQTFAAKLLQKIISYWGKSKGFDTKEECGSQTKIDYE